MKATDSFAYVKEALERYPEFRIATTSEINNAADTILKTNISNESIEQTAQEQLLEASEVFSKDLLDKTTEWGFDAVPVFPAVIIAVTEGRAVLLGRTSLEEALERGAKRLGESTVFTVLGATLTALDVGIISVPSSVAARIGWRRVMNRIGMTEFIKCRTEAILVLAT